MALSCPAARLERILLSTDGSEFSEGAVREAIKLSKTCSGKILAISVIETNPEYETIAPQLIEKAGKETRMRLESVKEMCSKEGVDCEITARQGEEPYRYIVEEAEKNKADLIVLGRRGRTGLKRLMMGSVTAKVIGHAPCDVLVVPKAADVDFRKILVATDGSKYGDAAVSEAIAIAKRCDAPLVIISVVPSETESPFDIVHSQMQKGLISDQETLQAETVVKAAKNLAEENGVNARAFIYAGKPYDAVLETAKEQRVNLIVVGSHGRTGIARLLMGSVTERVIGLAECAVLVVKK
ncbi:MAG: universal stress protein [Nitrospirae bacterium]|nr:universal stress protein [Nitrospirota bacterium]